MRILILNSILTSCIEGEFVACNSIKDCMIYSIVMGLKKAGHSVTLAVAEEYRPHEPVTDFEILYLPSRLQKFFPPVSFPYHPALWKFLWKNRTNFDMVLTSEAFSLSTFQAVLCMRKRCVIWQELVAHNRIYKKIPSLLWYNVVVRLFYKNVLIVPRSFLAKRFISQYSSCVADEIVDNGVDLSRFTYSLEKENYFIVFCRLTSRKRVDEIILRFADFIRQEGYSQYRLHIVGDGPLEEELKQLVARLGIQDSVLFKGFMSHDVLNQEISKAIALLVFTRQDLNMVSVTESIVSGTPVLTNTVPASAELIASKGLGIVQDDWNVAELNKMVRHHQEYASNCREVRHYLSNEGGTERLVRLFLQKK